MDSQTMLLDQLVASVLNTLSVPRDVVTECVAKVTRPARSESSIGSCSLAIETNANEPYYPISAQGSSGGGVLLLKGTNRTGKTTLLITSSILLGADWEDESFVRYLQGQDKYILKGKRFQYELKEGKRNARLVLSCDSGSYSIELSKGIAKVESDKEGTREFKIYERGWRPFRDYVRSRFHVQFIPQNRSYLRQVYLEVANELLNRLNEVESFLRESKGGVSYDTFKEKMIEAEREVEDRKARINEAQSVFDSRVGIRDTLLAIEMIKEEYPDKFNLLREFAVLDGALKAATQLRKQCSELDTSLKDRNAKLRSRREIQKQAQAALEYIRAEMDDELSNISCKPLRIALVESLSSNKLGDWLDFKERYEFADPGIYSQLRKSLEISDTSIKTFPIEDKMSGELIENIGDLYTLFDSYYQWSIDYADCVSEKLKRFTSRCSKLLDIRNVDLIEMATELEIESDALLAERGYLKTLTEQLQGQVRELSALVGETIKKETEEIISAAQEKLDELSRMVSAWEKGSRLLLDLEGSGQYRPELFRDTRYLQNALNDANDTIRSAQDDLIARQGELAQAEDLHRQYQDDLLNNREIIYARAFENLEYVIPIIKDYLLDDFVNQVQNHSDLLSLSLSGGGSAGTIDLYTPISRFMQQLVHGRCTGYYTRENGTFVRLEVQSLDLVEGVLNVVDDSGVIRQVVLAEEMSTGTSTANTVTSLASRTQIPAFVTVILVDEWSDVDQEGRARLVYDEIAQLAYPVVSVFTMTSRDASPLIVDARQEAQP